MTTTLSADRTELRATVTRPWEGPSERVQGWHRDRLALVYVRQSTPQQVHDHQESTRLQYGLTSRARELGWADHDRRRPQGDHPPDRRAGDGRGAG